MLFPVLGFAQGGERGPDGRRISERVAPFKIVENIHYVGGTDMTVFLITTPEGHILIDSTYERDVPWIRQNIEELGARPTGHQNPSELPRARRPHRST